MMENITVNMPNGSGLSAAAVRFLENSIEATQSGRRPIKLREYHSDRGDRKRAARAGLVDRSTFDMKTRVVNRMTNHERTEWHRLGRPDIDWFAAEEFSHDRDYRVAA